MRSLDSSRLGGSFLRRGGLGTQGMVGLFKIVWFLRPSSSLLGPSFWEVASLLAWSGMVWSGLAWVLNLLTLIAQRAERFILFPAWALLGPPRGAQTACLAFTFFTTLFGWPGPFPSAVCLSSR